MKRIKKFFKHNWPIETSISLALFIIFIFLILPLDQRYSVGWRDIIIDANGLILSLFIYGAGISFYNKFIENKRLKSQYHEEIDDFRCWPSEEAKFKILGNIKRLINLGNEKFDLHNCYLKNSFMKNYHFINSNFNHIDLSYSYLVDYEKRKNSR